MVQSMPAYHRNDGNAVSKDVTVPGNVEKNRIFWLPLYVDQRLLYLYKEIVWKNHRRTGNFLPGGSGKLFAQKIFASCPNFYQTVEKKRGPYDATT